MKINKTKACYWAAGVLAAAALLAPGKANAGIAGTMHDFSGRGWNSSKEICIVCHTPHNAKTNNVSGALLWNRNLSVAVFTPYTSERMKAVTGQPNGATKLCLSCHDGTIAVDRFGYYNGGTEFVVGKWKLGTDISDDHPVSFTYDAALAASVKTLKDPVLAPSGLGGTIAQDLLRTGKLQCVSCHNPHNNTNGKFLVKSNVGSALCLTCHNF